MTLTEKTRELVERFVAARQRRDGAAVRACLIVAPRFCGPVTYADADAYAERCVLGPGLDRVRVLSVFAEGREAALFYEFERNGEMVRVAEQIIVVEGFIAEIRTLAEPAAALAA
jgi:hypothetical protein